MIDVLKTIYGSEMDKMKIFLVAGARPNFMKVAPLIRAIEEHDDITYKLIHTGQHYDHCMSEIFFEELEMPEPDVNLEMKSTSYAALGIMMGLFEQYCIREKPDIVLTVGDVDSTLAVAFVTSKLPGVKLAHVEAGCRSFDRSMPEEINRVIVDTISDYCFCTDRRAEAFLVLEGIPHKRIFVVGDTIIANLWHNLLHIEDVDPEFRPYALATLHRQANVDDKARLKSILEAFVEISKEIKILFPIHPRTQKRISAYGLDSLIRNTGICITKPLGYLEFLKYMKGAEFVLTDSGGIQTETSMLDVPCVTLRDSTEHYNTVNKGINVLCFPKKEDIIIITKELLRKLERKHKWGCDLSQSDKWWDRSAGKKVINILAGSKIENGNDNS